MLVVQQLNVPYLLYSCVPEPWKMLKGQEVFFAFEKDPKAMLGNIHYFRFQSIIPTR